MPSKKVRSLSELDRAIARKKQQQAGYKFLGGLWHWRQEEINKLEAQRKEQNNGRN